LPNFRIIKDWIEWKRIAHDLVESLASDGLDASFRIGQSMSHIIFSTIDHHRLEREPRITIEIKGATKEVRIAYCDANIWFNGSIEEKIVSESEALLEMKIALRKLWNATKPTDELPKSLKSA
jgi:hypothetical protein